MLFAFRQNATGALYQKGKAMTADYGQNIMVEIHQAKAIVQYLNEMAQIIMAFPEKRVLLAKIDAVKKILETDTVIKEEK